MSRSYEAKFKAINKPNPVDGTPFQAWVTDDIGEFLCACKTFKDAEFLARSMNDFQANKRIMAEIHCMSHELFNPG